MAADVLSDIDRNFLSANLLETDDWAFSTEPKMEDMSGYVTTDTSLSPEAFFPDDLEMNFLESGLKDETWKELSDGSDSGIDALSMKPEPLSPSSFFSDASSDFGVPVSTVNSVQEINTNHLFPNPAEMTQEEWESIQTFFCEDVNSTNMEFVTDGESAVSFPDSTVEMATADTTFSLTDYCSLAQSQNIVAVPVTVKSEVMSASDNIPLAGGVGVALKIAPGVNHVLSSKVKIQPRPLKILPASASLMNVEKMVTVTQNTQPIATLAVPALSAIHSAPQLSKLVPSPPPTLPTTTCTSLIDVKAVKRQQRMIKNRESACLSRKRKKDYMQSLEQQLHEYNLDNERLRSENATLKRRVAVLQTENERLKKAVPVTTKAGLSVLLCVMFIMSVNYLPFPSSSISSNFSDESVSIARTVHTGRTLKSVTDAEATVQVDNMHMTDGHRRLSVSGETDNDKVWKNVVHDLVFGRHADSASLNGRFFCPTFFNSTESLRLVNELRGWVLGHEEELRRQHELQQLEQAKEKPRKKYYAPRKLKAAMRGAMGQPNDLNSAGKYEVSVFKGSHGRYDNFLDAINRRNDTFYVVSFRRDHLLLPATAHNKTSRPRMSVMMPAVGLNETMQPPFGSIAMMQIDCEVTATKLIHIDKSAVPHHMLNNSAVKRPAHNAFDSDPEWVSSVSGGV